MQLSRMAIVTMLLVHPAPSQQEVKAPVPMLNPDGSIPRAYAGRRVFVDQSVENVCVIFHVGDRSLICNQLARSIEPSINVSLTFDKVNQLWHYSYRLSNKPTAKLSATLWFFKDVQSDSTVERISKGWASLFPALITSAVAAPCDFVLERSAWR